jgi:predicted metal-dependent phosphotriesterase family hydrolase
MEVMDKLNADGMLFVTRKTIPYLKQLGVTDAQIRAITVENPRRFFGGA